MFFFLIYIYFFLIAVFVLQRHHIRERSLSVVNMFLDEMAKEAKNIITTICDEQCTLSDKVTNLSFFFSTCFNRLML